MTGMCTSECNSNNHDDDGPMRFDLAWPHHLIIVFTLAFHKVQRIPGINQFNSSSHTHNRLVGSTSILLRPFST